MSPTISPERPMSDASSLSADDQGAPDEHPAAESRPASSTQADASTAPLNTSRAKRISGFLGRHRWAAALLVIVLLASLAGLGAVLQGARSGDSAASGSSEAIPPFETGARTDADPGVGGAASAEAAGSPELADRPVTSIPAAAGSDKATDVVGPGGPIEPAPIPEVAGVDRDLVRTATLDLDAEEPDTAAAKARSLVGALGGRIAQEQTSFSGNSSVVLTLAIPPKNFDAAMEQLSELGKVTNRTVSTDDVTGQVTDLEGRITTLKASITRLQGFLADASDAGQIGMLEGELLRRETELEGIQGQLRTIEAQVAESTVTLTVTEPGERPDPVIEDDDDGVGFMDGLTRGWEAFTAVVNAIVVALAAIAPFLGIALVVWLLVRLVRRRRSAARPAADAATSDA